MICGYAMKMMLQIEDHTAFKEAEKKGEEFNKSRKQPKKYSFIATLQKKYITKHIEEDSLMKKLCLFFLKRQSKL